MWSEQHVALQNRLNYRWDNRELLLEALRHPSAMIKPKNRGKNSFQRLEWLGDAVIEMVVTERLFMADGLAQQGILTERRKKIVCAEFLSQAALRVDLGKAMDFRNDAWQSMNDAGRRSALSDAMEAVVGAAYLDYGMLAVHRVMQAAMI